MYSRLSFVMVGICIVLSFFVMENQSNRGIFLLLFAILSITGVVFAILSKRRSSMIIGVVLNSATFAVIFLLMLATGIGEA